jgi:hypothetical protein
MNYNNIAFFIGDENLYEIIFNTPKGWKCRNLDTKVITFIQKGPININTIEWSGLTLTEILYYIQENNNFINSPLNNILTQRALKWYNLLKKNNITLPKKEEIIIEEIIPEIIIDIKPPIKEETTKKRTRKKN